MPAPPRRSHPSILDTAFGGDGTSTFALPDLRGCVQMAAQTLKNAGSGTAHNNRQPLLSVQFCIAATGTFRSRP